MSDSLLALFRDYPDRPPTHHIYCSSEAEVAERKDSWLLVRAERAHFRGQPGAAEAMKLFSTTSWGTTMLADWEAKNAAGRDDPELEEQLRQIADIAARFPDRPPQQVVGVERDFWGRPHDERIRRTDGNYFRNIKARFLKGSLNPRVLEALRGIPVWGAARLKEWEVEKQQLAREIWDKAHRPHRKSKEETLEKKTAAAPRRLDDSARLISTRKLPRRIQGKLRIEGCNGKTVAEALKQVMNGTIPLSREAILKDIRAGLLRVEGDASSADSEGAPATPARDDRTPTATGSDTKAKRRRRGSSKPMVFRGFNGERIELHDLPEAAPAQKQWRPLAELLPGDIDNLSVDGLAHYEAQLGLSAKRTNMERVRRLAEQAQASTLMSLLTTRSGAEAGASSDTRMQRFAAMSDYDRSQLSIEEIRMHEQSNLIEAGEQFTKAERCQRLKEAATQESRNAAADGQSKLALQRLFRKASASTDTAHAGADA